MNILFCCVLVLFLAKEIKPECHKVCLSEELAEIQRNIKGVEKELSIGTVDLNNGTKNVVDAAKEKMIEALEKNAIDAKKEVDELKKEQEKNKNDLIDAQNDLKNQVDGIKKEIKAIEENQKEMLEILKDLRVPPTTTATATATAPTLRPSQPPTTTSSEPLVTTTREPPTIAPTTTLGTTTEPSTVNPQSWIMIQKHDFTVDDAFRDRKWRDYREGFGESSETSPEFWLGLDRIHALTSSGGGADGGAWTLRIRVKWDKNWDGSRDPRAGTHGVAEWRDFKVASAKENFRLNIGRKTKGYNYTADSFNSNGSGGGWYLDGKAFTTSDVDNDKWNRGNCAIDNDDVGDTGAWWYNRCSSIRLNGRSSHALLHGGIWRRPAESVMWIKRN